MQMVYAAILKKAGFAVACASDGAAGLERFDETGAGIVLLDLMLPDRPGLEVMQAMLARRPATRIIVITANGSINVAVEAMRKGAFDFLVKPFDETRLVTAVENACGRIMADAAGNDGAAAAAPDATLDDAPDAGSPVGPPPPPRPAAMLGESPPMRELFRNIRAIGRSMATVFITGESGTGKELAAQAVHAASPRAAGPFVPLNCGAIPGELLESEVFGHVRGAFTGAVRDKPGAAALADGGTLFLDEICEMDLNLQTKLLRFLQTSTIQPVGAPTPRKVSVRIVCATNRDPLAEVRAGRFREDLFYRLHVVPIHMPPLRERGEDVILLAETLLGRIAAEEGRAFRRLDDEVKALFRRLPWPGNVRQLLNVLRNVVVLNEGETVTMTMLPLEILHMGEELVPGSGAAAAVARGAEAPAARPAGEPGPELDGLIGRPLAEIERMVIEATLAREGGSVPRAAAVLGVSPSTLYRKLAAWRGDARR